MNIFLQTQMVLPLLTKGCLWQFWQLCQLVEKEEIRLLSVLAVQSGKKEKNIIYL